MKYISLAVSTFVFFIILPLLIFTLLAFPNFDYLAQHIRWFDYTMDTQHYLFWGIFWAIVLLGSLKVRIK